MSQHLLDNFKLYVPHLHDYHFLALSALDAKLIVHSNYSYYGQVDDAGLKHGRGIQLSNTGRKYEGEFIADFKAGYGYELFANGSSYLGVYHQGKPHGQGKFIWSNGEYYQGDWVAGVKCGQGKWQGANGDSYEGDWVDGKANGQGLHIWVNGDRYVGEFKHFLKEGKGQEYFANGDQYIGNYEAGKPHGFGEYTWSNGAIFKGYFVEGFRNGKGIWRRSKEQGKCDMYQGEYVNDQKNGYGVYSWANGNVYKGHFLNDYKHGEGEMYYDDGSMVRGMWETGTLIVIQEQITNLQNERKHHPDTSQTQRTNNKSVRIRQYASHHNSQRESRVKYNSTEKLMDKIQDVKQQANRTQQKFLIRRTNNDSFQQSANRSLRQPSKC